MSIDIVLEKPENVDYYDFAIENGDFKSTDGLDPAILMSLLIDARADASEVPEPSLRRGWIGNEQNEDEDYQVGSKLWLLDQARANQQSLNKGIDAIQNGLAWMIEDQLIKGLRVDGTLVQENILYNVGFIRFNNTIFNQQFLLWENTEGF